MENYQAWAEEVLEKVKEKMVWVSEKNKDIIPYTTDANGNYDDRSSEEKEWNHDDGLNWWTNGFWGGIMWLLHQDTKEEKYAQIARVSEQLYPYRQTGISGYRQKSSTLLYRQHPGEWYYSRRLPSAHAAGLGGFLRCMYHCRWSLRGSEACTGAYHDSRHHFTMVYADYYFIEALYKLTGTGILLW